MQVLSVVSGRVAHARVLDRGRRDRSAGGGEGRARANDACTQSTAKVTVTPEPHVHAVNKFGDAPGGFLEWYDLMMSHRCLCTLSVIFACGRIQDAAIGVVLDAEVAPTSDASVCPGAQAQPLASATMGVFHILLDAANVYWVDSGGLNRRIIATPKGGGPSMTLATSAGSAAGPQDLAIDDTWLYYFGPADGGSALYRVAKTGGAAETLVADASGFTLLADATSLYWSAQGIGGIMTMPKAGGTAHALVPKLPSVHAFVMDATHLYCVDGGGRIFSLPKPGGVPTLLANAPGVFAFTVYGTNLYWTGGVGQVFSMSVLGGSTALLASGVRGTVLAVDGTGIYTDLNDHLTVARIPLGGGTPVATGARGDVRGVGDLALDGDVIYWGSNHYDMRFQPRELPARDVQGRDASKRGLLGHREFR